MIQNFALDSKELQIAEEIMGKKRKGSLLDIITYFTGVI